jgi:CheY-like chemotaxis protein
MTDAPLILLVDDFEDALEMYREYLVYRGFRVIGATNGDDALEMCRRQCPDVILLDLRMPGLSGLEVVRILRADATCDGSPIVALTAHALEDERVEALRAGFDEVIAKPCLPDQLVVAIERLLRERASSPNVLVATDLEDHADVYATALVENGFRAHVANTGDEALDVAARLRPACAVIDLRLPDMSGWEVCRRLKAQPENALVRLIVLTQELSADAATGEVKVGCHAWLMQPTIAQDVVQAVRDVLASRKDRPATPADAIIGVVECPACASQDVRAGIRLAAVQYYCCRKCRLCWRVEPASAV